MADDVEEQPTESEALRDVATAVDAWKRDCDLEFTPNTHSPDDVAKPAKVRPHDFRINQKRRLSLHPPRAKDVEILTTNNDQDPDGDNAYKSHPPKPTDIGEANVLRSPSSARRAVIAAVDAWKRACDLSVCAHRRRLRLLQSTLANCTSARNGNLHRRKSLSGQAVTKMRSNHSQSCRRNLANRPTLARADSCRLGGPRDKGVVVPGEPRLSLTGALGARRLPLVR
jgi:hypothetical protein